MTVTFVNPTHEIIFRRYIDFSSYRYTNEFLAAVYLLSADPVLWSRAKKAISGRTINFEKIERARLSCYAYTLLHLAQDFFEGTTHVILSDVVDSYQISDRTCEMIFSAIGICRDGYKRIGHEKKYS